MSSAAALRAQNESGSSTGKDTPGGEEEEHEDKKRKKKRKMEEIDPSLGDSFNPFLQELASRLSNKTMSFTFTNE